MNLIFIGIQGSGKGTQAKILAEKNSLAHISTGDLLRNTEGELKKEIDSYINNGKLIPDDLLLKILKQRIQQEDCKKGFILDGSPRTIYQSQEIDKSIPIDKVIEIHITDEEALKRLSGRLNCKSCGAIFNTNTNPPKKEGICDNCQGELYQRDDDKEEAIKARLKIYHEQTEPLLEHYEKQNKLIKINGQEPIEKVTEDILEVIKN